MANTTLVPYKCEPANRQWPGQKCNRCNEKGLPCSENQRAPRTRATDSYEPVESLATSSEPAEDDFQQFVDLFSRVAAFRMYDSLEGKVVRIETALSVDPSGRADFDTHMAELSKHLDRERMSILASMQRLISNSSSHNVRFATASAIPLVLPSRTYIDRLGVAALFPLGELLQGILALVRDMGYWGPACLISAFLIQLPSSVLRYQSVWKDLAAKFCDDCGNLAQAIVQSATASSLPNTFSLDHNAVTLLIDGRLCALPQFLRTNYVVGPFADLLRYRESVHGYLTSLVFPFFDTSLIRKLLRPASRGTQDVLGRTLIHWIAIINGSLLPVILDEVGVQMMAHWFAHADYLGRTPLHLVFDIWRGIILEPGYDNFLWDPPHRQTMPEIKNLVAIQALWYQIHLQTGCSESEKNCQNLYHLEVKSGNNTRVEKLLDYKVYPVECASQKCCTALSLAAKTKNHKALSHLVGAHGVDWNAQDKQGRTALSWVAEMGDRTTLLCLLRGRGRTSSPLLINLQDGKGRTPLDYAMLNQNTSVSRGLISVGAVVSTELGHVPPMIPSMMKRARPESVSSSSMFDGESPRRNRSPTGPRSRGSGPGSVRSHASSLLRVHNGLMKDFKCCDKVWPTMHDLQEHNDIYHPTDVVSPPLPLVRESQEEDEVDVTLAGLIERI